MQFKNTRKKWMIKIGHRKHKSNLTTDKVNLFVNHCLVIRSGIKVGFSLTLVLLRDVTYIPFTAAKSKVKPGKVENIKNVVRVSWISAHEQIQT